MGRDETLDSGEVLVPAPHLRRFAESVFSQLGMTPEHAFLWQTRSPGRICGVILQWAPARSFSTGRP